MAATVSMPKGGNQPDTMGSGREGHSQSPLCAGRAYQPAEAASSLQEVSTH